LCRRARSAEHIPLLITFERLEKKGMTVMGFILDDSKADDIRILKRGFQRTCFEGEHGKILSIF
jgi:hypothetical protein